MEEIPIQGKKWAQDLEILVIPLSLEAYWTTFWADDAPFYIALKERDPDDEIIDSSNWQTPTEGFETQLN